MNTKILKSPGFWISALSAIVALLVAKGVILSGSTIDQVLGFVVALAGQLVGHTVAAPAAQTTPTTPAAPAGN